MATTVTLNGQTYSVPAVGAARTWGTSLSNYLIAISTSVLQKSGGAFTLTADANFGTTYGVISAYFKSYAANAAGNIATTGVVRLGNAESIAWRNNANAANVALKVNASDRLEFDGVAVPTISSTDTLTNKTLTSPVINTPTGIVKGDVGLGSVDNTSDATKDAATATLTNKTLTSPKINEDVALTATATELNYVDGVTSPIQTQLDAKAPSSSPTLVTPLIDDYLDVNEESAPSTPSAGKVRIYAKTDKKVYKKTSDGVESEVGSGGSGGINYITNPDAEGNVTTGWSVYADAAATTPVDGTGGTANITFTASSSSPLRGTYSFLITKDAANRQGQGASYDFTIAAADKGRPLGISWEGEASANYTGSTGTEYMVCYVYDVTNATLIATSNVNIASGSSKGFTTFLATTSTSYRLIFHIAGTGTAAWTYKLDSVSVGPEMAVQGAAVSDWVSASPVISGFSVSASTAFIRRVGDSMELIYAGTISSVSGGLTIAPPSGYTIDTSKISATTNHRSACGQAWARDTGTAYYNGVLTMPASAAYALAESSGGSGNWAATVPFTWASGDYISFHAFFPIVGWSSNVQMANRAVEEYASNSSTATTGDNTTSFAYGSEGSLFYSLTAEGKRRVRFTTPILSTDVITIEVRNGTTGKWTPIQESLYKHGLGIYTIQNGVKYGIGRDVSYINDTDIDIAFGTYAYSNSTYGAAGAPWSTISSQSYYWRVRKVSGGASVGFPVSTRNIVGDTSGTTVPSGFIGERVASSISTYAVTLSEADVTGASVSLTPGTWLLLYSLDCDGTTGPSSGDGIELIAKITNSSNTEQTGTRRRLYINTRTAATVTTEQSLSAFLYLNLTAPATYKIRAYRTGSGANIVSGSTFEAIRIA